MQSARKQSSRVSQVALLKEFEDRDCEFCEDGVFVVGSYKGNDAVICEACGAPILQFWKDR